MRAKAQNIRMGIGPGHGRGHGLHGGAEKAKDARSTMLRLWDYLRPQKGRLLVVSVLVVLTTGLAIMGPYLMGRAIDTCILKGDLPGLVRIASLMLAVYLAEAATRWAQGFLMASVAQRAVRKLRDTLFAKLQTLSLRFFDGTTHGELMSRLANDVDNVSAVLGQSVIQVIGAALMIVGVTSMMLGINWRLALVTLTTIPLMLLVTRWVSKQTRRGYRRNQEALGALNGIIEENITGARAVRAYCRERTAMSEFAIVNERLRVAGTRAEIFGSVLGPVMNLVNNCGYAIVVGAGGWMALKSWVTVGTIAAFINYAHQFNRPLGHIAHIINHIQSALAGAERVFEIMDKTPELTDSPKAKPLDRVNGDVVFDRVTFGYNPGILVLDDVSFHARPGQTVALVGPTGAGKTTLVNLLSRFYDIETGAILIDGADIRTIRKNDLRRALGVVLQDTYLFATSVMENIRYGSLEADNDAVIASAKLANADAFIRHLPSGYDTVLSERGGNLSQGQRQLIAIARAVLADPGILILDEATSSVDTRTEKHIQDALLRLMHGRTSFVIAHRLSTIREADGILVIDHGRIVERGTHESLMAKRGFYHRLYMSQFKGQVSQTGS